MTDPVTPARAPTAPSGPLVGIRVLDLASVGPAVRATRILSDYGAEVVKVAPLARAGAVQISPPAYAYSGGRLQRRVALDLKSAEGVEAFLALVRDADVLVESFRPGVMDRLGLGADACHAVNPSLIYCSTSGFGATGPRKSWAGHDINYLGVSGFLHCSSRRADGTPAIPGATVADIAAGGMHAAMAILAALAARRPDTTQRVATQQVTTQRVAPPASPAEPVTLDVSIADGALAMMSLYADEYLATKNSPGPGHYILTGKYAWYDVYRCADGGFVTVGAIEPNFFAALCRGLGLEQFLGRQYDDDAIDDMRAAFAEAFASRPRDEWVAELGPADCCVAPVLSIEEALADEQYLARAAVCSATTTSGESFGQLAAVWAGTASAPEGGYQLPDPNDSALSELLVEAGWDSSQIAALIESGAGQ